MSKLVTFGCSLTELEGLKEELTSLLNLPLLNVAECAGSNQLQLSKLSELIVHNKLNQNDIIYWQITGSYRDYRCLQLTHLNEVEAIQRAKFGKGYDTHHYVRSKLPNIFDKKDRLHLLCNSPLVDTDADNQKNLEILLSSIILLKHYCPKLLIVFGWENAMSPYYHKIFKQKLDEYNINYLNEGFVDFTVRNKLNFRFPDLKDDIHPDQAAGQAFAKVIYDKMYSLGWV